MWRLDGSWRCSGVYREFIHIGWRGGGVSETGMSLSRVSGIIRCQQSGASMGLRNSILSNQWITSLVNFFWLSGIWGLHYRSHYFVGRLTAPGPFQSRARRLPSWRPSIQSAGTASSLKYSIFRLIFCPCDWLLLPLALKSARMQSYLSTLYFLIILLIY